MPKFIFFGLPLYLSDILIMFSIPVILINNSSYSRFDFGVFLLIYFFIFFGSLYSSIKFQVFDFSSYFVGIKRFLYIFYFFFLGKKLFEKGGALGTQNFYRIVSTITTIGLIPICFSFFEIFSWLYFDWRLPQISLVDYDLTSYNSYLFPVGFTGRVFTKDGLAFLGSSSINYGILNSFFFFSSLVGYVCFTKKLDFFKSVIFLIGALMSMSSTVLLILLVTFAFLMLRSKLFRLKLLFPSSLFILVIFFFLDRFLLLKELENTVLSFIGNSGGNDDNVFLRFETFRRAINAINLDWWYLFFGAGYLKYLSLAMGYPDPLVESFFLETLLAIGVLASFSFSYFILHNISILCKSCDCGPYLNSFVRVFICSLPILIFVNLFSGNSFSSEFFGSFFFFIFGFLTSSKRVS